jgi:DNA mismatch repair ATPase MutS
MNSVLSDIEEYSQNDYYDSSDYFQFQERRDLLTNTLKKVPLDNNSAAAFYASTSNSEIEELQSLFNEINEWIIVYKKIMWRNDLRRYINTKRLNELLTKANHIIRKKEAFRAETVSRIEKSSLYLVDSLAKCYEDITRVGGQLLTRIRRDRLIFNFN